ncbi:hypothetical protein [Rhizobium laguerreae]|uniref:hypothetical protein n=1 Tax=Rhizobium laguerreae TaxID=1076926 RepID=UPI00103D3195|nr:hypothetical protein [Rhizobium laguerreae]MBN9985855.1 hypothetical protein [Rhizobium laguerreae]MBY3249682.1 hypothetical protein [Rhizobium laguerreae]MBY3311803.1 hypothetical protein [Rhizobium laguerreae]MBY3317394.1 hypothetical protein [Rhizobium laguerreae]MBY3358041.1 hypothetical protein [Rhizobium laguerreae]
MEAIANYLPLENICDLPLAEKATGPEVEDAIAPTPAAANDNGPAADSVSWSAYPGFNASMAQACWVFDIRRNRRRQGRTHHH